MKTQKKDMEVQENNNIKGGSSEIISTFLKLLEKTPKEYSVAYEIVNEKDKELQDIIHKAELNNLNQNEKSKLMTELARNRRDRRYWKDKVDGMKEICDWLENKEVKNSIELLKQVLGKVRRAESYLQNRSYKPKAKKNQKTKEEI